MPNDEEQQVVHDTIHALKKNCDPVAAQRRLAHALCAHKVDYWRLGCAELHLLSSTRSGDFANRDAALLDPLDHVAELIKRDMLGQAGCATRSPCVS